MPRDSDDPRRETLRGEENIDPATGTPSESSSGTNDNTSISTHSGQLNSLSLIEHYLHLTPLTPRTFTNTNRPWHPPGARGIYGGEIIGQSIIAAAHTVPNDLWIHSIHAYFVLAGNANIPITYAVEDVRTGKSFATRQVNALQRGKPIFVLIASFQRPVGKERKHVGAVAEWQGRMPEVLKPGEVLSEEEKIKKGEEMMGVIRERLKKNGGSQEEVEKDKDLLSRVESAVLRRKLRLERDPFEWRKLPSSEKDNTYEPYSSQKIRFWVRSRTRLSTPSSTTSPIPHAHLAALSYFTDNWFIGTVGRVNPSAGGKNLSMLVSLDHAIYFHLGEETRVDDFDNKDDEGWMLVEMDAPWVGEERGLVTQRIWRGRDGRLVATCVQEGLVRLKEGSVREGERGEEGVVVGRKMQRGSKL